MDYSRYFWQGDKVRLRPLSVDDAENVYIGSLDTPSRQMLQLGTELPKSIESIKEFLEKYSGCRDVDGLVIFAVENLDGENVGGISFHSRHRKNRTFGVGLDIDRPYWRNGYGADAARILLRYAFNERGYQKCNSACIIDNEASIALHKKLGFLEEGRRRRMFYYNGIFHDEILFGLTIEEFEVIENAYGK
jgi:RimJ/RimL family protein N-acetyltransferase